MPATLFVTVTALLIIAPVSSAAPTGTAWAPMTVPPPATGGSSVLSDVSCPHNAGKYCVAVGYNDYGSVGRGNTTNLAMVWKGGAWGLTSPVSPGGFNAQNRLWEVSCVTPSSCMAIGASLYESYAELWNGSKWTVTLTLPGANGSSTSLSGISCTTSACLAVGYFVQGSTYIPVAYLWNGQSWAATSTPSGNELLSASCISSNECSVLGVAGSVTTLLDYSNGAWTTEPAPPDSTYPNQLVRLDCLPATSSLSCMTVGWVRNSNAEVPIADSWDQSTGTWAATSPVNPPGPASNQNEFRAVSCPVGTQCVAVGPVWGNSLSPLGGFAEIWNGSAWALMDTSKLTTLLGTNDVLNGVSCPTSTFCVAVGNNGKTPAAASWGVAP